MGTTISGRLHDDDKCTFLRGPTVHAEVFETIFFLGLNFPGWLSPRHRSPVSVPCRRGVGLGCPFEPATYGPGQLARTLGYWPLRASGPLAAFVGERWHLCVARLAQYQGLSPSHHAGCWRWLEARCSYFSFAPALAYGRDWEQHSNRLR